MPRKRQRSISVRGTTYQRIQLYVEEHGGTVANFLEQLIVENLGGFTEEDRRKFGEDLKRREKETVAEKAAEEEDAFSGYIRPTTLF